MDPVPGGEGDPALGGHVPGETSPTQPVQLSAPITSASGQLPRGWALQPVAGQGDRAVCCMPGAPPGVVLGGGAALRGQRVPCGAAWAALPWWGAGLSSWLVPWVAGGLLAPSSPPGRRLLEMLLDTLLAAGRRHRQRVQLYWDFQLLDADGDGRLPAPDAELLLREVPGASASGPAWQDFLQERGHGLAWGDIEAWLSTHPLSARAEPGTGCPGRRGTGLGGSSAQRPGARSRHCQRLDGVWDTEALVPGQVKGAEALWSGSAQALLDGLLLPPDRGQTRLRQPLLGCALEQVPAAGLPLGAVDQLAAAVH
ncbi:uncharacterized protein LOC142827871 [Pelodiscus sinensis]|uniref:uncharacterized protein LOC142827871 n=1 Tax=Pelodiscus sinensis TaxID=13735 RepID=UPI003F6D9EC9